MLMCIRQFKHRIQAEHAKSLLDSRGILAIIEADDAGGVDIMVGFSCAQLLVHENNLEKADIALKELGL